MVPTEPGVTDTPLGKAGCSLPGRLLNPFVDAEALASITPADIASHSGTMTALVYLVSDGYIAYPHGGTATELPCLVFRKEPAAGIVEAVRVQEIEWCEAHRLVDSKPTAEAYGSVIDVVHTIATRWLRITGAIGASVPVPSPRPARR
ncbi:hypothetical protein GCM10022243_10030 [Saccharothrix violaceirubra]|uniref:Uncharacterized protein n=1 Tax=Saccharothrix violaceirubra TaxID=413306 RepID=A0A7W7T418_9PSEU|nr:hypothetical protein [Saccharothrix violaceirubra]MBB4966159.1 hypothetical protein [Saccharothrix violaceirubra]